MNKKSFTKDEKIMIELYQMVITESDPTELEVNPYHIGKKIGLAERGVNAIVLQLVRSNFIKRHKSGVITITDTRPSSG